jgi:signal transduction histidine kinase
MTSASAVKRPITVNASDAVAFTAAAGLTITLVIGSAGWGPAYENRPLHLAKETVAALVLLLVAALLAGRVARRGTLLDLLALAGVLVLATKNLAFSALTAVLTDTSSELTTWRTTGAGMIGAALLAVAAFAPRKVVRDRRRAILITAVCSLAAFVLLSVFAAVFEFPGAFTGRPDSRAEFQLLSDHPALVAADVGATVLFLIAGTVFARRARREADEFYMWLAIGATIAAIGYLNYALFPSSYTDFLHAGDVFRLVAVLALGIGTVRELSRAHALYSPAAVLDERRRIARDLNDGVAQELAFIASRLHRLPAQQASEETIAQITEAVRRAMDTSRRAISALSRPLEEPLHVALANTAREVVGLADTRLELRLDADVAAPPAWEQALQDIVREALTNAIEHGHARTVSVHLHDVDGISLRITDDGDGFDTSRPPGRSSFGVITMRERTESLGGTFKLNSTPGRGTSVEILLP